MRYQCKEKIRQVFKVCNHYQLKHLNPIYADRTEYVPVEEAVTFVIALCPNCHRRAHYGNDRSEYNQHLTLIIRDKYNFTLPQIHMLSLKYEEEHCE